MAVASLVARVEGQVASFEKQFTNATKVAQKFERDFATTASSVTAQQKRIEQAFTSFSGDKLAREASAVAKAVEQIGGASKLTANEQARVNSTMTEAIAKYSALGQQAPKALLDLEQATRKVVAATADVPKQLTLADKAAGLLSGTFGQFTAANLVATGISALTSTVSEFIAKGAQLRGVQASFERLASAAKQSSGDILGSMRTATRGLVSDIDLMLGANKALLLGLPVTSQSMGDLATAATTLGRAMGQDATKSLDDLIVALGRSSPLILDNLGLSVKVGEANEQYARKLGKTAEALTDAERKTAFYEAAMEAARKKTAELGEQSKTLGEILQTKLVAGGNVITQFSSNVNVGLGSALSSMKNFAQFSSDMIQFGASTAIANAALREQIATMGGSAEATKKNALFTRDFVKELKEAGLGSMRLSGAFKEQYDAAVKLGVSQEDIATRFGISAFQQKLLAEATKETAKATKDLAQDADEMFKRVKKEADAREQLNLWMGKNQAALNEFSTKIATDQLSIQMRQLDITTGAILSYTRALSTLQTGLDNLKFPAPTKFSLGDLGELTKIKPNFFEDLLGLKNGTVGTRISTAFKNIGKDAALGLVDAIGAGIASGNWSGVADVLQGAAGAAIATGINALVPGLGTLLAPITDALLGKLRSAFGGPSKDELLGRDVVASFEQSLANSLSAVKKLEAGNEGWKLTTIAVRDAYVAAGRTAAEAEAAVKKLWDSSKGGADKSRLAVLEIQAVMDIAAEKQKTLGDEIAASSKATDAATSALTEKIKGLSSQYDALFRSIENEAPEEEMGILERKTRDAMASIEREIKSVSQDGFGRMGDAAEDAMRAIEEAFKRGEIKIPIDFILRDGSRLEIPELAKGGIVRKPTLALIGEDGLEAVVPLGKGARPARLGGLTPTGSDVNVFVTVDPLTGRVIDQRVERVTRRAAATGRLRTRSKTGRSF